MDSLNALKIRLTANKYQNADGKTRFKRQDDILDEILELLYMAYGNGVWDAADQLGLKDITYDLETRDEFVNRTLKDGKNWRDRVLENLNGTAGTETSPQGKEQPTGASSSRASTDRGKQPQTPSTAKTESKTTNITGDPIENIIRIVETEAHSDFNEGSLRKAASSGKARYKRWSTMLDDRVRDTHFYLQGMRVPIDASFYTYDGDSAYAPGGFFLAENNVNCRCTLKYEQ